MAQPVKCEDRSVLTPAICERVEINRIRKLSQERERYCESQYKDGRKPTPDELAKILESHAEWLSIYEGRLNSQDALKDPRRANLCGVDLRDLNLQNVDLRGADLQEVHLGRNLAGIKLERADLS